MFGTILSVGASIIGGSMQADAAEDAANIQAGAARDATAEQRRQFELSRTDLAPYRDAGGAALQQLRTLLGLGPSSSAAALKKPTYEDAAAEQLRRHVEKYGVGYQEQWRNRDLEHQFNIGILDEMTRDYDRKVAEAKAEDDRVRSDPNFGALTRRFTLDNFRDDPVVQKSFEHGLSEGEKAVRRMFGARGLQRSGAAVKAATRFAEDYAGQQAGASRQRFVEDQTNLFNKHAALSGVGQTATTTTAQLGANTAANIGELALQTGNARGSAAIARGNAWSGALNNIGNTVQRYVLGQPRQQFSLVEPVVPGQFNLDTYG